jgi:hypothetical protein
VVHPDYTYALQHALAAAAQGLAVFPLARSKLPAIRSPHRDDPPPGPGAGARGVCHGECGRLGHGVYDASADPVRVRELFAAAPWARGYGVACGRPPRHLIGLDLDRKGAADGLRDLAVLAAAHDFTVPLTRTVITPSGGRHLWLSGPADLVVSNSVRRIAPGIDVRGSGGYLVGPGSRTRAGRYRLAPGSAYLPPAPAPEGLLRLLAPPPAPPPPPVRTAPVRTTGSAAPLVNFVLGSVEGERNERLYWAACRAYQAGHGEDVAEALVAAALRIGLPEREVRATVASAARRFRRFPIGVRISDGG